MEGGRPQGRENFWEVLMHYQGGKKKRAPTTPLPVTGQPQLLGVLSVGKMNFAWAADLLHFFPYT